MFQILEKQQNDSLMCSLWGAPPRSVQRADEHIGWPNDPKLGEAGVFNSQNPEESPGKVPIILHLWLPWLLESFGICWISHFSVTKMGSRTLPQKRSAWLSLGSKGQKPAPVRLTRNYFSLVGIWQSLKFAIMPWRRMFLEHWLYYVVLRSCPTGMLEPHDARQIVDPRWSIRSAFCAFFSEMVHFDKFASHSFGFFEFGSCCFLFVPFWQNLFDWLYMARSLSAPTQCQRTGFPVRQVRWGIADGPCQGSHLRLWTDGLSGLSSLQRE